ncbi:MAG TPA: DUF2249 domain-containing protein [Acidimicrobiales bacterium]|nr:DUF2249 domain-containing protein [Acidimicrobiales bacterium]
MTITEIEAFEAMLQHHRTLVADVDNRIAALSEAVNSGTACEPAVAELITYLAEEVIPHAAAEELSIYRTAATRADLAKTVDEMIAEHRVLTAAVESLANASSGPAALTQATQIATFFTAHVVKENELLLPALLEDNDVDLVKLLEQMHQLTSADSDDSPSKKAPGVDSEAVVVSLLLEAANELAKAGHGDRACRLVASAWAALRSSRPALAVKTTASLHRLARSVASEPITLRSHVKGSDDTAIRELDVRHLAPAQRHETIFSEFHALAPGSGYVLVNDHDPKPLRYQFEAEHAGEFTWDALESGPEVWRVRIARPLNGAVAIAEGDAPDGTKDQELDVRVLPHGQRHEVIFATYDRLVPGGGFVIVNDHDPKPLRYQFEAQHAGEFTWDYLESGPKLWRVRVGRTLVSTTV